MGNPNKRLKREAYLASQISDKQATSPPQLPSTTPKKNKNKTKTENRDIPSLPQKKYYRQRAHANPFSDHRLSYPTCPSDMDWTSYFPSHTTPSGSLTSPLQILDIGCGFGGLLLPLSTLFPHRLILGLELRSQVVEYAWTRILALRGGGQIQDSPETPQKEPQEQSQLPAQPQLEPPAQIQEDLILPSPSSSMLYTNIAALRTNAMKYLPNFIHRGTLTHIFICFPDPHFKARKHKARIVTNTLCSEYAYLLRPGGMACTITDVEELGGWMADKFRKHPLFEKVEEREYDGDGGDEGEGKENSPAQGDDKNNDDGMKVRECVDMMRTATEESKKVTRNGGKMFVSLWRRKQDPDWP